ncbi:ATP-dependent Lon protease [Vibrio aquaticus]|uniref:ATP-dependent Lon protease n=1 Tax=Vibrio aquaticus TaxID=2496559 RepID=A0A3S0V1W2_9VIBR|nr:ATP-dependent Lon protease [Vibrio aquaticus]RTZ14603.1 ATP-dependent Lon protease [Vibrio aquaticus]
MLVSPTNVSVPLIAPSVNVQTEQAARDNKVREPIAPTLALAKSNAERKVTADDKRRKQSSWDPSEHPSYETEDVDDVVSASQQQVDDPIDRLFKLLSLESYSEHQGKGYAMRFRLPRRIIDAAIAEGMMAKRRTVIKFHYGHAVAPNTPSDVIAVL